MTTRGSPRPCSLVSADLDAGYVRRRGPPVLGLPYGTSCDLEPRTSDRPPASLDVLWVFPSASEAKRLTKHVRDAFGHAAIPGAGDEAFLMADDSALLRVGAAVLRVDVDGDPRLARRLIEDAARLLGSRDFGELSALLSRHRAARVGKAGVVVVLQGRRSQTIRIVDVRPHIIATGPVPDGTCVSLSTQGEGDTRVVTADLDAPRPPKGRSTFLDKSIDLALDERVTVDVEVGAKRHFYEWDIEVTYDYGDGAVLRTTHIGSPTGGPFRLTGAARRYQAVYRESGQGFAR